MDERHEITKLHHPDKMNAREFIEELKENFDAFLANMDSLRIADKKQWVEVWWETFGAWTEIKP